MLVRYFAWLLVYHLLTFYKQKPWAFFLGLALWPYHIISRHMLYPREFHKEVVRNGISALKSYWEIEGAVTPPSFVKKQFAALEREAAE
jgi:hypothetical protein